MSAADYTHLFWAKAHPYKMQGPERIHLLEHHLADVSACMEALLAQPTIRRRLATAAGRKDLDAATTARLCVFASLHDIGKVNVGFQTQIWRDQDYPPSRWRPGRVGHTLDLVPVLSWEDRETAEWFLPALGWWQEAVATWDDAGGETVCALFIAALSHHGRPLQWGGGRQRNPALWRPYGDLHPRHQVEHIGALVRGWYTEAFKAGALPLPDTPAFQHMFLGLCNLTDWIGSNTAWFPYEDRPVGNYIVHAREMARRAVAAVGLDIGTQRLAPMVFERLFDFEAYPVQQAAGDVSPLETPLVIIESETGSGKTEAALWRFARMHQAGLVDGLYFALPTRAAATQLHSRVTRFVARLFQNPDRPEPVLAVPGYLRAGEATGKQLPHFAVEWDDEPQDVPRERRWAAESAKRYLAAQIAVGTVDQAMMGALQVKNAHMRAACLARNLLVVDEVHASDTYMRRILRALLDAHLRAGGYALLMSATLGSAARSAWLSPGLPRPEDPPPLDEAIKAPYPAISVSTDDAARIIPVKRSGGSKVVQMEPARLMNDFDGVAQIALAAARAGGKALVVRNTVGHAVRTQQTLEAAAREDRTLLFACNGVSTLHHGRFASDDRRLLDQMVEERLGRERSTDGVVVVGTQTLEQSLDIDADVLITDLCPADVLLQRIGRLHRQERSDRPADYAIPRCIVLAPEGNDLSPLLQRRQTANGLGPHGGVYKDLRVLEATRRLLMERPEWHIPKMNRELVERATHPDALQQIVQSMGPAWEEHARSIEGGQLAEGLTARNVIIRRDKSFFGDDNRDVLFGADEEKIRTRLGDEGIDVEIAPPQPSPFPQGEPIARIAVPARWLRDISVKGPAASTSTGDGGFTFALDGRAFRYDRWGLQREG